jgi:hypothetical protein
MTVPKQSQLEKAIEKLNQEISVLLLAVAKLREQQGPQAEEKPRRGRKPKDVAKPKEVA